MQLGLSESQLVFIQSRAFLRDGWRRFPAGVNPSLLFSSSIHVVPCSYSSSLVVFQRLRQWVGIGTLWRRALQPSQSYAFAVPLWLNHINLTLLGPGWGEYTYHWRHRRCFPHMEREYRKIQSSIASSVIMAKLRTQVKAICKIKRTRKKIHKSAMACAKNFEWCPPQFHAGQTWCFGIVHELKGKSRGKKLKRLYDWLDQELDGNSRIETRKAREKYEEMYGTLSSYKALS